MKNSNIKKPLWLKSTITLLSVLLGIWVLAGAFSGCVKIPVSEYYANSKIAFEIPGLSSGFVPQGFCYDDKEEFF